MLSWTRQLNLFFNSLTFELLESLKFELVNYLRFRRDTAQGTFPKSTVSNKGSKDRERWRYRSGEEDGDILVERNMKGDGDM